MNAVRLGTDYVLPDEPCLNLSEVELLTPNFKKKHRYQIVTVVRSDREADFKLDMGPASGYVAAQLRIPGGFVDELTGKGEIVHTVAELREIADQYRGQTYDYSELPVHNLYEGLQRHEEKRKKGRII